MSSVINTGKHIIICRDGKYKIGDIEGFVPKNCDCIISDWHLKDGKIIKKGKVDFVPGKGTYHFTGNTIE